MIIIFIIYLISIIILTALKVDKVLRICKSIKNKIIQLHFIKKRHRLTLNFIKKYFPHSEIYWVNKEVFAIGYFSFNRYDMMYALRHNVSKKELLDYHAKSYDYYTLHDYIYGVKIR